MNDSYQTTVYVIVLALLAFRPEFDNYFGNVENEPVESDMINLQKIRTTNSLTTNTTPTTSVPLPARHGSENNTLDHVFSYQHVEYVVPHKGSLIVVFTDISFLSATKEWYKKMVK